MLKFATGPPKKKSKPEESGEATEEEDPKEEEPKEDPYEVIAKALKAGRFKFISSCAQTYCRRSGITALPIAELGEGATLGGRKCPFFFTSTVANY